MSVGNRQIAGRKSAESRRRFGGCQQKVGKKSTESQHNQQIADRKSADQ